MGSPEFAIPGLMSLHESHHEITGVVTGIDKRRGRGKTTSPTPVKQKALELGLPVIEVQDLKSADFAGKLKELGADLFVVVAFRVLPEQLLSIPRIGSINLHGSLLPKYRGAAPIHRAVMHGETKTGCTIFFLDKKVDTGQILGQKEILIGPNETTGSVYERMMKTGADLLLESVNKIAEENYTLLKQKEEEASSAPKIFADDCPIDFNQPAAQVHNFVRGLSPFPAARTYLDEKLLKIFETRPHPEANLKPYELHICKEEVLIGCNPGAVSLKTVQLEGKPKSSGVDFFRGYSGAGVIGS